jgi:hypothetical protein
VFLKKTFLKNSRTRIKSRTSKLPRKWLKQLALKIKSKQREMTKLRRTAARFLTKWEKTNQLS